jgi:hypothetical protein
VVNPQAQEKFKIPPLLAKPDFSDSRLIPFKRFSVGEFMQQWKISLKSPNESWGKHLTKFFEQEDTARSELWRTMSKKLHLNSKTVQPVIYSSLQAG